MHDIVYSPQKKWFFLHIPKNGGTSISEFLRQDRYAHRIKYGLEFLPVTFEEIHNPVTRLREKYSVLEDCQPLCIVRNPWARCLSLYTFNLENTVHEKNYNKDWAVRVHARLSREGFKPSWMPGGFFRDEQNMQQGITCNPGRYWKENDAQSSWITPDTKIFKLEKDLEALYAFMEVPYNKKVLNKSKHYDYHYYYDSELQQEIAQLYRNDIETFGYTF